MEFLSKENINSKDLLKQINYFREMEYQEKKENNLLTEAQKKRGHYIELTHYNILKIIRDEFNIKVNAVNKNAVKNTKEEFHFRIFKINYVKYVYIRMFIMIGF